MHLGGLVMGLTKIKLGKHIELYSKKCNIPNLRNEEVSGVNKDKEFFEPSNQVGGDTSKYKVVPPKYFACNLMHVGRDMVLPIAYNHSEKNKIVSPAYQVFKFIENNEISSEYFFLCLKSTERDRYFWFNTDSSVRDGMSWEDFTEVEIRIPPVKVQQKYVDVYNAMLSNQRSYERGLEDLKLVCDAYIEKLKSEFPCKAIGEYVHPYNEKNVKGEITLEQGINIDKKFITPQRANDNFYGRKIVRKGHIAYCTQLNNENIAIALRTGPDCIVSGVYDVIEFNKNCNILPNYLMLWLIRSEFGRFVYWASQGTSYEFLTYENLANYKIPVPDIELQKSIADIYEVYLERKEINEKLKAQIKDICPILIKGSIEEGRKTKG